MAAFTASQASVTNGSKVVTINSSESIATIRQGDFLFLAGFLVEINRGYVGSASQQYIELVNNWANSNQSNQKAVVIPTTGDFRAAVDAINNANKNVNDNFVAMQNWQTKMGAVTFVNQDGSTTNVKTLKQIEADNATQMDAYHPYPWAMRKVEFEARRAANNEKFAASGFVHFGKHRVNDATLFNVNEGLYTYPTGGNSTLLLGDLSSGATGESKTNSSVLNISGITTYLQANNSWAALTVKLPPAEGGTRTYDSATGISVTHATPAIAFASETATNKVVTDRVDMWGILQIEQEINDSYPFVYLNGLPQSVASSINDVPTTANTVQPIEYFAQYAGDTSSRGKGVNWQTATQAQRIAIASDPNNKIRFDDSTGHFYQTHDFVLSFAGIGNSDWLTIDAISGDLAFSAQSKLVPALATNATKFSAGNEVGVFTANNNPDCHFLVCGTINRLNRGAYHPSLNPFGTGYLRSTSAPDSLGHGALWNGASLAIASRAEAFDPVAVRIGGASKWGKVGGLSGRPDGRFYDVIYTSGQGGVCRDMRYSACGLEQESFTEADLKIKSGEYRGHENVSFTKLLPINDSPTVSSSNIGVRAFNDLAVELGINVADSYYVYNTTNGELFYNLDRREMLQGSFKSHIYYPETWGNSPSVILIYILKQASVAGEFLHTDVIGPPAKILQCDDLKDGWLGRWLPQLVQPSKILNAELSLPCIGSSLTQALFTSNQITWANLTATFNPTENTVLVGGGATSQDNLYMLIYNTKAKITKNSVSSSIYGGVKGIGKVDAITDNLTGYSLLTYSLAGIIPAQRYWLGLALNISMKKFILSSESKFSLSGEGALHNELSLHPPISGITGVKALNYSVVENQQGFINYAYTELKHDGTDWGDDGKIHIVDGQSTMLDENGNTVLVGTARCVEPLGWIKNDK
ncbi:hypothetical protein [Pseudoalteromonas neustonica]|uniref:hypothetical protein n=1 Tax=Pseudoalteromonas neustonica TaxID=1840331 RepID=UPI0007DB21AA|nr:hypothetical protein [Pseudoalteromonas neustonica]